MARIALLTPRLHDGDAVSNDLNGMKDVLCSMGHDAKIFAGGSESSVHSYPVKKISSFLKKKTDILIYQYSISWNVALNLFRDLKCIKILKYHNVTPPKFFEPYHPGITNACRVGRDELKNFVNTDCRLFMSVSRFNMQDLLNNGAVEQKCCIVPPMHKISILHVLESDLTVMGEYEKDYPNKQLNILMLGRISPNKGYENLIHSFALYRNFFNRNCRLILVGRSDPQLEKYYSRLSALIEQYGLGGSVIFAGGVSDNELKAFYLAADVFVILSEHEGFCVPLLEAMSLKIPFVAYGSSAIPETAGNSGIIWEKPDPALFAASIDRIVGDEELSYALGNRAHRRYIEKYTDEKIREAFVNAIEPFL